MIRLATAEDAEQLFLLNEQFNGKDETILDNIKESLSNNKHEFVVVADCNVMFVGTGDCHSILSFYNICGFTESHRIKNFFIDNYDHPMFEDGKQLVDMVYLKRER